MTSLETYRATLVDNFARNQNSGAMSDEDVRAFKQARRDRMLGTKLLTTDTVDRIVRTDNEVCLFVHHATVRSRAIYHFPVSYFDEFSSWMAKQGLPVTG